MDKLKKIKVKQDDGTYGPEVPIGVDVKNIDMSDGKTLPEVLGPINVDANGTIKHQFDELNKNKVDKDVFNDIVETIENLLNIINNFKTTSPQIYNFVNYGKVFPNNLDYQAWPLQVVEYDKSRHEIVCLVKENDAHVNPTIENLYVVRMNPQNFEIISKLKIYSNKDEDQINKEAFKYMRGFCVVDGIYYKANYINGKIYIAKSSDCGENWETWIPIINNSPNKSISNCGKLFYNNGRFIFEGFYNIIAYSDDNMTSFTYCNTVPSSNEQTNVQSECDIIANGNNLMRIMRHSWSSSTTGYYNGAFKNEPADLSFSYDNGITWTTTIQSTSIIDMSANNACHVIKDGYVHLFVGSRRPYLYNIEATVPYGTVTKRGHIEYYLASLEDAFKDKFVHIKTLNLSENEINDNYSGIGCCLDEFDNVHLFYGDGNKSEQNYCRWKLLSSGGMSPSYGQIFNSIINDSEIKREEQNEELKKYMKRYVAEELIKLGYYPDDYYIQDSIFTLTNILEANFSSDTGKLKTEFGNTDIIVRTGPWDSNPSSVFRKGVITENKIKDFLESGFTIEAVLKGGLKNIGGNQGCSFVGISNANCFGYRKVSTKAFRVQNEVNVFAESIGTYDFNDGDGQDETGFSTISWTFNKGGNNIYLNGNKIITGIITEDQQSNGFDFLNFPTVKRWGGFQISLEIGDLAQLRIYKKELTESEIKQNYNAFKIYSLSLFDN